MPCIITVLSDVGLSYAAVRLLCSHIVLPLPVSLAGLYLHVTNGVLAMCEDFFFSVVIKVELITFGEKNPASYEILSLYVEHLTWKLCLVTNSLYVSVVKSSFGQFHVSQKYNFSKL